MIVHDEYRCRRCDRIFLDPAGPRATESESVLHDVELEIAQRFSDRNLHMPEAHECSFGGAGIGEWIGVREVDEMP